MTSDTWEQRAESDADRFQLWTSVRGIITTTAFVACEEDEGKGRTTA